MSLAVLVRRSRDQKNGSKRVDADQRYLRTQVRLPLPSPVTKDNLSSRGYSLGDGSCFASYESRKGVESALGRKGTGPS